MGPQFAMTSYLPGNSSGSNRDPTIFSTPQVYSPLGCACLPGNPEGIEGWDGIELLHVAHSNCCQFSSNTVRDKQRPEGRGGRVWSAETRLSLRFATGYLHSMPAESLPLEAVCGGPTIIEFRVRYDRSCSITCTCVWCQDGSTALDTLTLI